MNKIELIQFMQKMFFGNSVQSYLAAVVTLSAVLLVIYLVRGMCMRFLRRLAQKTGSKLDDFQVDLLAQVRHPELFMVTMYVATRGLELHASMDKAFLILLVTTLSYRAVRILQQAMSYGVAIYAEETFGDDPHARSAMKNIEWLGNLLLWTGGVLFVLDNLGVNVTALVAGLGIGGLAMAMASQQILGDLFNSFTIFMDKPFKVNDFISVGDLGGTVEHIGVKTTRIRAVTGEILVFPNSDLTGSRVRNYGDRTMRRLDLKFAVTYQTPVEKVALIPEIVREIVAEHSAAKLDRIHFTGLGESSLDFTGVCLFEDPDYAAFMEIRQKMNLAFLERFAEEGIEFAYPTQTVLVETVT